VTHGGAPDVQGAEALARLRRFGGDTLARDLAAMFVESLPGRAAEARAALAAGDRDTLARVAHGLKSSCAQLGGVDAAARWAALEAAARAAAPGAPLDALAPALAEAERAADAHAAWLAAALPPGDA
jgi:HPt (histidine-containing phosphotransfer) domain-containing protein